MAIREQGATVGDAESVIRRVPGVSAVRVEPGEGGSIGQIHVLASADRSARVMVGDVIAALGAELGVAVEPAQVRVAVLKPGETQPGPAPLRARLKLAGLTATTRGDAVEVRVRVEHEGLTYEGAASGRGRGAEASAVVALAALRAVETYLRCDGAFQLKAARVVPVGSDEVAVALVAWTGPGQDVLSGSAVVGDDPRDAMARAVLDAVNRPVSWLGGR